MHYLSTRGEAYRLGFADVMLAGLARDGGLYVPETYPQLTPSEIAGFAGRSFGEVAQAVIAPFVGDVFSRHELGAMIEAAYAPFRHAATTPLAQIDDNLFVLELFHGPTLAFKDVAMLLLGAMMDFELKRRGRRATIVGATSGDTGAAAVEAFAGREQVDLFILFPHGRVSEVQRLQMTTVAAENVHALAVEGTFDDCQAIVKGLFNHHAFADMVGLSGVNSINWARVVAQATYYFASAVALGGPGRAISYSAPTGNFGDVLAGYVAKRMGLPIDQLVIATNANDILARTLATGAYEVRGVEATQSPSMDIQVSSNFERLLFDAGGRDAAKVRAAMAGLAQSRGFTLPDDTLARVRAEFRAEAVSEAQTTAEIARTYAASGYILDPHTAVGVAAARRRAAHDPTTPMVTLGTAHPAKFPDAIERAIGLRPQLPRHLADLRQRREAFAIVANDQAEIERFVLDRARGVRVAP